MGPVRCAPTCTARSVDHSAASSPGVTPQSTARRKRLRNETSPGPRDASMKSLLKLAICLAVATSAVVARADVPYPWEQPPPRVPYSFLICPLVGMSGHCGNHKCERLLAETA